MKITPQESPSVHESKYLFININSLIIFLIYLQYISLGYKTNFSIYIEILLLIIITTKLINYKREIILIIVILLYYSIFTIISKESLISLKNLIMFLSVYFYFIKKEDYLFSTMESMLLSILLVLPIMGNLFNIFQTDFSDYSNLSYVKNIFSPANIGLNYHFSAQIFMGYFILVLTYYYKVKSLCNYEFFGCKSLIIILIIFAFNFYLLFKFSGTSTSIFAFIITIFISFIYILFNKVFFLHNKNNRYFIFMILSLFLFQFLIELNILYELVFYLTKSYLHGLTSFQIINYEFEDILYFLFHSPLFPTFVSNLDTYQRYIFYNSEISFIKNNMEYGIILFFSLIFFLNKKFSPVAIFFLITLIHSSFLLTALGALLSAKMNNFLRVIDRCTIMKQSKF